MKLSLTGTGIAVFIIMNTLNYFGITTTEDVAVKLVESCINISSIISILYGQFRRHDVKGFIFKK